MRCEMIVDPLCEERVVIYTNKKTALAEEIRSLIERSGGVLFGYRHNEIVKLTPTDIHCICVVGNKVYALCDNERYWLKERLYVLETTLPDGFVKINQSCLGNVAKMERFDTSLSGTLKIRFQNGHVDYVSRRQLKAVKERIGI